MMCMLQYNITLSIPINVSKNIFVQSESPGGGLDPAETVVPGQSRDP